MNEFKLTSEALFVWVTTPSIRAEADRSMLFCSTHSIQSAQFTTTGQARLLTDLFDTGAILLTFGVSSTLQSYYEY